MTFTRVLKVSKDNVEHVVKEAADYILRGKVVVGPTETVYGIFANAYNRDAVLRVFEIKRRPLGKPLTVHIGSIDQMFELARGVPDEVYELVRRIWPGPLTVVLRRSDRVLPEVSGGTDSVGIRLPAHDLFIKIVKESVPVVGPSANLSGRPSATCIKDVMEDLMGKVDLIIDDGDSPIGIESTVVDFTRDPPVVLRVGALPVEEIEGVLGRKVVVSGDAERERYLLSKPVLLVTCSNDKVRAELIRDLVLERCRGGERVLVLATSETALKVEEAIERCHDVKVISMGSRENLLEVARSLFKLLRQIEREPYDVCIAEGVEERGLGAAIASRLRRAASRVISC